MTRYKTTFIAALGIGLLLNINAVNATVAEITPGITWAGCGVTKKAFMDELARAYETKSGVKITLQGGGATRGIRDAAKQRIDIGGSCRMNLPEEERSELYANMHPVAWDALAIIVHKNNPVTNLTTDQIKAMYMGEITNWQQVGGPDAPVKMYARRGKISGVGYAIRQYIFKDSNVDFKTQYQVASSGPLEQAVEQDEFAVDGAAREDVSLSGPSLTLGGGLGVHFTETLALDVQLLFTGGEFDSVRIDGVSVDGFDFDASSSRFNVGLSWWP